MVTVKIIYENLKTMGLTRAQARKLLPDWWTPEMEESSDGLAELCMFYSRRLNLDFKDLMRGAVVSRDNESAIAYKHTAGKDPTSLRAATGIARALAGAVLAASKVSQKTVPASPTAFAKLTKEHGKGIVSLASLIDTCWSLGVPVIPMPNLPLGVKKMDGAVVRVSGGSAIIISRKKSSRAWLSFILSHEIGHLARGHLSKSGSIIDVSLQEQATYAVESSSDKQEREADDFALSLMGGDDVESIIAVWPTNSSPIDLAVMAKENAAACGVEPGHLILRFAFKTKRWTESVMGLNYLREDADADLVMKTSLSRHLDLDQVSDDMSDFVRHATGLQ